VPFGGLVLSQEPYLVVGTHDDLGDEPLVAILLVAAVADLAGDQDQVALADVLEVTANNAPQTTLRSNETQTAARHAAKRASGKFNARRSPSIFAARSHRKSPEKAMWFQPTGDVWASISSETSSPMDRRCATASAM